METHIEMLRNEKLYETAVSGSMESSKLLYCMAIGDQKLMCLFQTDLLWQGIIRL